MADEDTITVTIAFKNGDKSRYLVTPGVNKTMAADFKNKPDSTQNYEVQNQDKEALVIALRLHEVLYIG